MANAVDNKPGELTRPRSRRLESNWVTQMPALSPWMACCAGLRKICIDFTLRISFKAAISTFWKGGKNEINDHWLFGVQQLSMLLSIEIHGELCES